MKRFIETDPHELTGNVSRLIGRDWMLVTAGKERSFNTMTASWGGLGVLWNAPVSMIFVRPSRYTYEFIEREREYSLSFLGPDDRRTLQVCGSKSGRDIDKVKGDRADAALRPAGPIFRTGPSGADLPQALHP